MQIKQFRYSMDNFSYLFHINNKAFVIDPGAVDAIIDYVEQNGLILETIANTHGHADHTAGNNLVVKKTGANHIPMSRLTGEDELEFEGIKIKILHTPGHTHDSVCFIIGGYLITGDTLFNGTIGNCFSGDMKGFFNSLKMLMQQDENLVVYAGHDYVKPSLIFAKTIEPGNKAIDNFLSGYDPAHVCSTLKEELAMNPYLRFNEKSVIAFLEKKGLPVANEWDRFQSVMKLE